MRLQLKRMIGVLGLAAMAAMLVAAMGATSAYAKAEFKAASFPVEFLGEGLGLSRLLSENLNLVLCHMSSSTGSVETSLLAKVTITYLTGCELKGTVNESCPTITTNELLIHPLSKLNGGTKLGLLFLPKSGTELAKFTCGSVTIKVKRGVICESTPGGRPVLQGKVICKANPGKHGFQEFTSGTGPLGGVLTTSLEAESTIIFFKGGEPVAQETTEDVTYKIAVEQVA
jgi:hypothetical protein